MVLWMKHNMFCIEDLNVSVLKESQRGSFMFQTCFLIVSFIFITHIMDNSIFFQKCRSEVVLDCLRSSAMAKIKMVKKIQVGISCHLTNVWFSFRQMLFRFSIFFLPFVVLIQFGTTLIHKLLVQYNIQNSAKYIILKLHSLFLANLQSSRLSRLCFKIFGP